MTGDLIISAAWIQATGETSPQIATGGSYSALQQTMAGGTYYRGFDAYLVDSNTNQISATWPSPSSNNYATVIAAFKP